MAAGARRLADWLASGRAARRMGERLDRSLRQVDPRRPRWSARADRLPGGNRHRGKKD